MFIYDWMGKIWSNWINCCNDLIGDQTLIVYLSPQTENKYIGKQVSTWKINVKNSFFYHHLISQMRNIAEND